VVHATQEGQSILDSCAGLSSRNSQRASALSAHGQQGRHEALLQHLFQLQVYPDATTGLKVETDPAEIPDLRIQNIPGQPIFGDPIAQHASSLRLRFEDRHRIPEATQVVGGGQARRTRPYDRHLGLLVNQWPGSRRSLSDREISDESLQGADSDRLIDGSPTTDRFTWVMTNPTTDSGQGTVLPNYLQGFCKPALGDQRDVGLDVDARGTCLSAGGRFDRQDR